MLKKDFIHNLLIFLSTLTGSDRLFRLSEKSFTKRLKKRGVGGYLGDTKVFYPENVSVGDRCTFGGNVIINGFGEVEIGNYCMLATNVIVTSATHDYSLTPMNQITIKKKVKIGDNVWVGSGAMVLPGVEIANGSVIAAGAVVSDSIIEEDGIYGGVPARFIKKRK